MKPLWEHPPLAVTNADVLAAQDFAQYFRTLPDNGNQVSVAHEFVDHQVEVLSANVDRGG